MSTCTVYSAAPQVPTPPSSTSPPSPISSGAPVTLRKRVHYKSKILFETAPGMQVLVGPQGWNDGVEVSGGGGGGGGH